MDRAADTRRLADIRARWRMLDRPQWLLSAQGSDQLLDSRGEDGSLITIATFSRYATADEIEFITRAADDVGFLLGIVDRAIGALRPATPKAPAADKPKDHTTEAAMLCADPAFKRFLMERHGLDSPASDDRMAQKLRSLLGVTSRKDINESDVARERWLALRDDFKTWKRAG